MSSSSVFVMSKGAESLRKFGAWMVSRTHGNYPPKEITRPPSDPSVARGLQGAARRVATWTYAFVCRVRGDLAGGGLTCCCRESALDVETVLHLSYEYEEAFKTKGAAQLVCALPVCWPE